MQRKSLFSKSINIFQSSHHKTKQKLKTKCKKMFVELTEKNLKMEKYINIYDTKLI